MSHREEERVVSEAWRSYDDIQEVLNGKNNQSLTGGLSTKGSNALNSSKTSLTNDTLTPAGGGYPIPDVDLNRLPQWIQDYAAWHMDIRERFPGERLFNDTNAPKLLIRRCTRSEKCGGLHDRLGKIPWDFYLANQTGRVLLYNWCKPAALEDFLVPNILDWSVPTQMTSYFGDVCTPKVNRIKDIFHGFKSGRPGPSFWANDLDAGLQRAVDGKFASHKILKLQFLGREDRLKERLEKAGETDMLAWDTPSYGLLFWLLFKPSPGLQRELDGVYNELNLVPNEYSAVHCRVRHPKAVPAKGKSVMEAKIFKAGGPDSAGLKWTGESRKFAIETATRALRCLATVQEKPELPVYFYSDSEDLVQFMANDLVAPDYAPNASSLFETAAHRTVQTTPVVSRRIESETLHIDRQSGHPATSYYPSFVDLLVAARANCISLGVGNYALFASKLSGNHSCLVQYQSEHWGDNGVKGRVAKQCELDDDDDDNNKS